MPGIINSSSFAKALWPGVNAWYGKEYDEYPVEWDKLFESFTSRKQYEEDVFTLLIEQLVNSLPNQLPMYADKAMPIINEKNKMLFIKTLSLRLDDIEKDTKRKRVEKVISKVKGK